MLLLWSKKCQNFSHPDYTVGVGVSPTQPKGSRTVPPVRICTLPQSSQISYYSRAIMSSDKHKLAEIACLYNFSQTSVNQNLAPTVEARDFEEYKDDIDFLTALALQNDKVVAVRVFETENARVFGILTTPIYLKSEREELIETLTQTLSQSKETYVSLDNDVFRKIRDDMTEEQKEQLLLTVINRRGKN